MFAASRKLDNLVVIVDNNGLQAQGTIEDRLNTFDIAEKWRAFGWNVLQINGHNMEEILTALDAAEECKDRPTVIIAHTVKGKGISFAENQTGYHNKVLTKELYEQALEELSK